MAKTQKSTDLGGDLHGAARSGDLVAVQSIYSSNRLAINSRDKHSRTPYPLPLSRQSYFGWQMPLVTAIVSSIPRKNGSFRKCDEDNTNENSPMPKIAKVALNHLLTSDDGQEEEEIA